MLKLPERTPEFTVMRAAWSSAIERVSLDKFYIYLCPQINLLSHPSLPLANLWLRSARGWTTFLEQRDSYSGCAPSRRPGISREPASQFRGRQAGSAKSVSNDVEIGQGAHRQ